MMNFSSVLFGLKFVKKKERKNFSTYFMNNLKKSQPLNNKPQQRNRATYKPNFLRFAEMNFVKSPQNWIPVRL